jgi:hypothetical protein
MGWEINLDDAALPVRFCTEVFAEADDWYACFQQKTLWDPQRVPKRMK